MTPRADLQAATGIVPDPCGAMSQVSGYAHVSAANKDGIHTVDQVPAKLLVKTTSLFHRRAIQSVGTVSILLG